MMAEIQPPSKPNVSKQDAVKSDPPKVKPEQLADVDAKTAAKNRSSFFNNS
jgi:hypothetical protein